jgi:peptidoglycan/xylan/chitin deacetylase (PgdA/CDA1 family)
MFNSPAELWWIGGAAAACVGAGAAWGTFAPAAQLWGPIISRGSSEGSKRVALTFDDGPLPGATDRILDALGELKVKAAFFVIGAAAERYPELICRMQNEGHLIGNHSYRHAAAGFMRGPHFWQREIALTDAAIVRITGRRPWLFRPPLGIKTPFIFWSARRGHVTVTWTRRAFDGVTTSTKQILDRLLPHSQPGEILALHDGVGPQSRRDPVATVDAIRPLIGGLRDRGLEPVELDVLLANEFKRLQIS